MKTKTTHTTFKVEKEKNAQVLTEKQAIARAKSKSSNNFVTNFKKKQKNKEDRKNLTFFYANFMQRLDTKNSKLLTSGKKKATTSAKEKKQYFFGENRNRAN